MVFEKVANFPLTISQNFGSRHGILFAKLWKYNLWFAIKNYPVFTENDKHPTKLYILLNVFNPSCGFRGQVLNTMIHPKVPKTFGSQTTAWTHVLTANFSRSWPNVDSKAERGAFNLALWASDFQPEPPKSSEARVRKHWLPPHVGMASRNIKYKWRLFFFRTNCVYIYMTTNDYLFQ